ncbi:MAG TPA: HD domain-containing phosphohydrolase [Solirubrobacteraceae bacterium]|nr:HD domain-containing phosphohydrolase [Solirubrobacteraceae bacterium]
MDIRLSEIISALSHALDVTGGQPMGHAERSCLIGLRLADAAGFDSGQRASLFYALLLKDAGCSTNSAAAAETFGTDDHAVKREYRLLDTRRPAQSLRYVRRTVAPEGSLRARAQHLRAVVALGDDGVRRLEQMRCERGAEIARCIDLDEDTAAAISQLDEHWNGDGYPAGLAGEEISPLARVMCLAQTMEVFWQQGGPPAACAVARERRGTWFDPALVDAVAAFEHDAAFWASLTNADVNALEPADRVQRADHARLDRVAEAFAGIVDAKSPFTARHSAGVAAIAEGIADTMGLDAGTRRLLRRAGLLHDVGKLGVSNRILDKPGRLTEDQWAAVRRLPSSRWRSSRRCPRSPTSRGWRSSTTSAWTAAATRTAWWRTSSTSPRGCWHVADVAEALSAPRPYREAMDGDAVLRVMGRDAGSKLDAVAFGALEAWLSREGARALVDAA